MNRLTYIACFAYWLLRQRSWVRAKWVMEYEGHKWN